MKKEEKIIHINPNCLGAEFCEPHGETGEVYYSSKNIRKLLIQEKQKLIHDHEILVNTILEEVKSEREKVIKEIDKAHMLADKEEADETDMFLQEILTNLTK